MRLLLIALTFMCIAGCNKNVRISNENAISMFQAQQIMTNKLLHNHELQEALIDMGTKEDNPLKTIEEVLSIAESGEKSLVPVRDSLKQSAQIMWMGGDEVIEPDVTPEEIVKNVPRSLATIDFRTKLAEEEVKHSVFSRIINNPYVKWGGGIAGLLTAAASAYFGLSKFHGVKKLLTQSKGDLEQQKMDSAEELHKHKLVTKNSIHYAKDMEELARDPNLTGDDLAKEIDKRRMNSMTDQHKYGVAETMNVLMGEVKQERRI